MTEPVVVEVTENKVPDACFWLPQLKIFTSFRCNKCVKPFAHKVWACRSADLYCRDCGGAIRLAASEEEAFRNLKKN